MRSGDIGIKWWARGADLQDHEHTSRWKIMKSLVLSIIRRDVILIGPISSVAVATAGPGIPAVQHGPQYARSIFSKTLDGDASAFGGCLPGTDDQDHPVREPTKHSRIRQVNHGGRVNQDHVKFPPQARQQAGHARRIKEVCGSYAAAASRQQGKRSEERRVGKECRAGWDAEEGRKKSEEEE